jgi:hypothetical protein
MNEDELGKEMIGHRILYSFAALILAFIVVTCLPGAGVKWQYETDSNSSTGQNQSFDSPSGSAPGTDGASSMQLGSSGSGSATSGSLWGWGGTPRGFSAKNGTLNYPSDYYSSHFDLGYPAENDTYGHNSLQNLSRYSTGFTTGGYAKGMNIASGLTSNGYSSYDPWNNYPGADPNYPNGYPSS